MISHKRVPHWRRCGAFVVALRGLVLIVVVSSSDSSQTSWICRPLEGSRRRHNRQDRSAVAVRLSRGQARRRPSSAVETDDTAGWGESHRDQYSHVAIAVDPESEHVRVERDEKGHLLIALRRVVAVKTARTECWREVALWHVVLRLSFGTSAPSRGWAFRDAEGAWR